MGGLKSPHFHKPILYLSYMKLRPYQAPRRQPKINDMIYPPGSRQGGNVWIGGIMMNVPQPSSGPAVSPTPTPTITATPTVTPTSSLTPTPTITPTNTVTPSITPTITLTPTPSSSAVPSGTTEANTYLTAVVNNGGTIDSTISAATRTLFTSLVSSGLYNKMLAMYPLIGGVANSAKLNAVNVGTYDITWNGGMSFTTTGATSNGTNGFGDTGIVYSSLSSYYLNGSYGVQFHNNLPGGVQCPMGAGPSNSSRVLFFSTNDGVDNQVFFDWGSDSGLNRAEVLGTGVRGLYIISSPTTSSQTAYRNGSALSPSGGSGNKNTAPTSSMLLFKRQDGYYYPGTESFAFVGGGLTAGEVSTLSGIINTYQTSLGRNLY